MPYVSKTSANDKFRLLISGFPNTGKTTSLATFCSGLYSDKTMVILSCPGEFGIRSLPVDIPNLTAVYYEPTEGEDINSAEWSRHALNSFDEVTSDVIKSKPDVLAIDGIHSLWSHLMNRATDGEYLKGVDLNINPKTGRAVQYRAARYYSLAHASFGQYIAGLYSQAIPLVIATTWEEWEAGTTESQKPGDIEATRYLWPAVPGSMAKAIVGKFDARVSARIERRCLHTDCEDAGSDHFVWQFLPRGDVQGVGVKGLKINRVMKEKPWIHQNWGDLRELMEIFS